MTFSKIYLSHRPLYICATVHLVHKVEWDPLPEWGCSTSSSVIKLFEENMFALKKTPKIDNSSPNQNNIRKRRNLIKSANRWGNCSCVQEKNPYWCYVISVLKYLLFSHIQWYITILVECCPFKIKWCFSFTTRIFLISSHVCNKLY